MSLTGKYHKQTNSSGIYARYSPRGNKTQTLPPYIPQRVSQWGNKHMHNTPSLCPTRGQPARKQILLQQSFSTSREWSAGEGTCQTYKHSLPTSREGSASLGTCQTHKHSLPTSHEGSAGEGTPCNTPFADYEFLFAYCTKVQWVYSYTCILHNNATIFMMNRWLNDMHHAVHCSASLLWYKLAHSSSASCNNII